MSYSLSSLSLSLSDRVCVRELERVRMTIIVTLKHTIINKWFLHLNHLYWFCSSSPLHPTPHLTKPSSMVQRLMQRHGQNGHTHTHTHTHIHETFASIKLTETANYMVQIDVLHPLSLTEPLSVVLSVLQHHRQGSWPLVRSIITKNVYWMTVGNSWQESWMHVVVCVCEHVQVVCVWTCASCVGVNMCKLCVWKDFTGKGKHWQTKWPNYSCSPK